MRGTIFILCYNEEYLLPHTINHYKQYLPLAHIVLLNNHSTDNSVEIAKSMGLEIRTWGSKDKLECDVGSSIRNNVWKTIENGWILMVDMDEFLYISEEELKEESMLGTTILSTIGWDMIGESKCEDLHDIHLPNIKKYILAPYESKQVCFKKDFIREINYTLGAHECQPIGDVRFSKKVFTIKHMSSLGLPYLIYKNQKNYKRSHDDRKKGWATHYTDDIKIIQKNYLKTLNNHLTET
jgi:glycosyltransferase involved in cell wall biosynthesis